MDTNYDFSGWATRANMKCSDGRTIMKDAFVEQDGAKVPLVWNHRHNEISNVLGHALLENRDDGVYAYCKFNDSEYGKMGREAVRNGDVTQLSIYANQLKQQGGNVIHGAIREVSLVLAGANPGAYIDHVLCHAADTQEEGIIYTGEDIELVHGEEMDSEEETVLEHADDDKKADEDGESVKKEDKSTMAEAKEQVKDEAKEETKNEVKSEAKEETKKESKEKTVKDVFDTFTEEQKTVVYALIGQALEDAGVSDDDADDKKEPEKKETENIKHSEGGNEIMYTNVFNRENVEQVNVLTHADQTAIIEMAKRPGMTFQSAMKAYVDEHKDTLAHGFEEIEKLFPEYTDVKPGAPELLTRDMEWVNQVMKKAHKAPYSRVRTRQLDARAKELRAKGYNNREEEKALAGNLKLLMRTTDPQTVYYRDALHRDDITDITDFDVVAYQKNVMKMGMEEMIALAALVGDGREDTDPDKISAEHIRPIWQDEELYTIHADVDVEAMAEELQGTNANANFGESFIFSEAVITSALYAREKYKGKGALDFYCTPHTLNVMMLARDLNGRRIYDSAADVAKVLNVANIYTVEQFEGLTREDEDGNVKELIGLFVNMNNYQFGSTKGGEITSFEQFDIDFNNYKYLMEARLSGALVNVYSAIALEKSVASDEA